MYITKVEIIYQELIKDKRKLEKYDKAGIYTVCIDGKLVYIGKSKNMLLRIAHHLAEIEKIKPISNKYKVLNQAHKNGHNIEFDVIYYAKRKQDEAIKKEIGYKEGVFIRKFKPCLNYQIPKVDNWRSFTVNKQARTITLEEILKGE